MSHTPGPWTITDDKFEGEQWLWIDGANGHTVCGFGDPETGISDQHRVDARLIAAAPDLLEALRHCLDRLEAREEGRVSTAVAAMGAARTAIAKATSQS